MASYLSICNQTRLECGVTASDLTTLAGVTGKNKQIAQWVSRAWMDVQRKHTNWKWMRSSFSFATVNAQQDYTPAQCGATDFSEWITSESSWAANTMRSRVTSIGYTTELWLGEWLWDDFRNLYTFGAQRTVKGRPVVYAVKPDMSLALGPLPDATSYTIIGDYQKAATALVNDTDIPGLPEQFTDIIMHRAKMMYGQEESAGEVYNAGLADYKRILAELEDNQLPDVNYGGSLL